MDIIGQQQNGDWAYFGYDGLGSVRMMFNGVDGDLGYVNNYAPYGTLFETYNNLSTNLGFTVTLVA